ncbi:hypothetical protein STEG23_024028, partial [Scotinomys teguina]
MLVSTGDGKMNRYGLVGKQEMTKEVEERFAVSGLKVLDPLGVEFCTGWSVKNCVGTLMGIAFNLQTDLGSCLIAV